MKVSIVENLRLKMLAAFIIACAMVLAAPFGEAVADDEPTNSLELDKSLDGIKFSVLAYIDYSAGSDPLRKVWLCGSSAWSPPSVWRCGSGQGHE